RQLSGRIVFASLEMPEGPYMASQITVSSIRDTRGNVGTTATRPLQSLVTDPGAVVSGRVVNADGTPYVGGQVFYTNRAAAPDLCRDISSGTVAAATVGADGRYE